MLYCKAMRINICKVWSLAKPPISWCLKATAYPSGSAFDANQSTTAWVDALRLDPRRASK